MHETNPPTSAQGPQLPPIDPRALVATAIEVLTRPTEFFARIKGEIGLQKPVLFAIAAGVVWGILAGVGTFLWRLLDGQFGSALSGLIAFPIMGVVLGVIGAFLGGLVVWGISVAFGSKAPWEPSVPIASYAMATFPAFAIGFLLPGFLGAFLGGLVSLAATVYQVYLCYVGARIINFDAPPAATASPPPPGGGA